MPPTERITPQTGESAAPRLYLIDGYGFVFRAYHVLPPLTDPRGTPVGAVYGFTNMLMKLRDRLRANNGLHDHIAVIFDSGQKNFRNELYPQYKANRPPAPEDLIPQFPLVREAAEALHLPAVSSDGYEADDVIATYAKQARAAGMKVTIVSSDKDLMQLVDDGTEMYDPVKEKRIGPKEVTEKFGVPPARVLDALSLTGDSSDNIPGVPGIGPKTAAELINAYGSLDDILAAAGEIKQAKRRESLLANAEQARLSRRLASLCAEVPDLPPLSALAPRAPDQEKLGAFLRAHGFKSLAARLDKIAGVAAVPEPVRAETLAHAEHVRITDESRLRKWLEPVAAQGMLALHAAYGKDGECLSLSLATPDGRICELPLAMEISGDMLVSRPRNILMNFADDKDTSHINSCHVYPGNNESYFRDMTLAGSSADGFSRDAIQAALRPLLEDESVLKTGHDIKKLLKYFPDCAVNPLEDVALMSYVLDGPGELKADAASLLPLRQQLRARLFSGHMLTVYETIERPLIPVLDAMERAGIKTDASALLRLSNEFAGRLAALEKEIHALAGHTFNVGSPKQLGDVLFGEMNLPGGKKSKTGAYGTDAGVLEELAVQGHTIAEKALAWRELAKLRSTYTDSLIKQINPRTGRIHTVFEMAATSTGRLSSRDPNLQNIPVRSEDGRKIRAAFTAPDSYALIGADYSQIELRLLAHVADIAALKEAFRNDQDIHAITASQVFGMPVDKVDADARRRAKAINFGIIYGQSAFGLAAQLGVPRAAAAEYIAAYFARYPGIQNYMESVKELARAQGYVSTLHGRKCFLPGIKDSNPARRAFAERAAINAPLQGSAADIIKKAMIRLFRALREQCPRARMLLQIHDELILEAPQEEAEKVAALAKREMERAASLSVPLTVEARIGKHWGEIH